MTLRINDRLVNGYYRVSSRKYFLNKFSKFYFSPHFFIICNKPKKIKGGTEEWKSIMIVALWKTQVLAYEILTKGTTVDTYVYLNFLERRLLPEVERKKFGRPIILHDNATPHKTRIIREFLQSKRWEELEHPPYLPDMSPPDMHGIALIKGPNKGKQFLTETELINDYDARIRDINKNHASKGINMLPDRWRAITLARGDYVV